MPLALLQQQRYNPLIRSSMGHNLNGASGQLNNVAA